MWHYLAGFEHQSAFTTGTLADIESISRYFPNHLNLLEGQHDALWATRNINSFQVYPSGSAGGDEAQ
jgi:hypothetical protein